MKLKIARWAAAVLLCGCCPASRAPFPGLSLTKSAANVARLQRPAQQFASKQSDYAADSRTPLGRSPRSKRTPGSKTATALWVGAYVPGWNQQRLDLKKDHLLDAVTCFLQFAVYLRPADGRLDLQANELTPSKMKALVSAAHEAGKQAFLVVGGEGAAPGLRIATRPDRLANTVRSVLSLVERFGYDGVDVDWEPLPPRDAGRYSNFIVSLRNGLDRLGRRCPSRKLGLTTAIEVNLNDRNYSRSLLETLRKLHGKLDRINLMTYAMANPGSLPFVWHNSALYPGVSPLAGFRTPSADGAIREFLAAGFQPRELGIGIDLYGYLWQGQGSEDISLPGKIWMLTPKLVELSCGEVVKRYLTAHPSRWDQRAQAPYVSIPQTNQFLSYEDTRGIAAKFRYVREQQLGGLIVWDIGKDRYDENAKRELLRVINREASGKSIAH